MSEQLLRSYRLTSLEVPTQSPEHHWNPLMSEEPSDEMLHAIMEKVAVAARQSTARVAEQHHQRLAAIAAMKSNKSASAL